MPVTEARGECRPRSRSVVVDRLWSTTTGQPAVRAGAASEVRQLLRHDVPRFDAPVQGTSLWDGEGVLDDAYFTATAATALRDRVTRMDEQHLDRQVSTIREAMSALSADGHGRTRLQPITLEAGPAPGTGAFPPTTRCATAPWVPASSSP